MTKAVVLATTLLGASLGVFAQSGSIPAESSNPKTQKSLTVIGCLIPAGDGRSYVLTEPNGRVYRLEESTPSLHPGINKEVQLTGQLISASNSSTTPLIDYSASGIVMKGAEGGTIQVSEVQVVSEKCRPVSNSRTRAAGQNVSPPAQFKRVSDPVPQDNRTASHTADAAKAEQLPQTSTILPLLGLIGLGSLVAGFFARK